MPTKYRPEGKGSPLAGGESGLAITDAPYAREPRGEISADRLTAVPPGEHPEQIGQFRATLWEIHPITRIEVFTGGKWVEP
jgi:hypothetical protein